MVWGLRPHTHAPAATGLCLGVAALYKKERPRSGLSQSIHVQQRKVREEPPLRCYSQQTQSEDCDGRDIYSRAAGLNSENANPAEIH